jgi:hypothetical protein
MGWLLRRAGDLDGTEGHEFVFEAGERNIP